MDFKTIKAGSLEVAYLEAGSGDGWPCIMCHGFPYDVHAFADAAPHLAAAGARVIVPFLRGYGPTRLLRTDTPRSGEQAALASDLLEVDRGQTALSAFADISIVQRTPSGSKTRLTLPPTS